VRLFVFLLFQHHKDAGLWDMTSPITWDQMGDDVPDWGAIITMSLWIAMAVSMVIIHVWVFVKTRSLGILSFAYSLHVALSTIALISASVLRLHAVPGLSMQAVSIDLVFVALVIKLIIASAMFWCEPLNGALPRIAVRCSEAYAARWSLLITAVPALLFVVADILRVQCQASLSLTEVHMIGKTGMPLTATIWFLWFRQPVLKEKVMGLVMIMLGACLYGYGEIRSSPQIWHHGAQDLWKYRCWMLAEVVFASFASISCEHVLRHAHGSVNVQNIAFYTWGLIGLLVQSRSTQLGSTFGLLTSFHWVTAGVFAAAGVATSFFLKYFGSIWKQCADGAMLVMFVAVDHVMLGQEHSSNAMLGVLLTLVGTIGCLVSGIKPVMPAPQLLPMKASQDHK